MPWNKSSDDTSADHDIAEPEVQEPDAASEEKRSKAFTPPKGRPTPKRNDQERAAGVRRTAFDTPTTAKAARKRRKELKKSMSKDEYKAMKSRERDQRRRERQKINERMMAGDEDYLMERDKGQEKRLVRNWVDSHRYLMNYFVPMAFAVVVIMIIGTQLPAVANLASILMLAIMLIMIFEGVVLGRKVNKLVNEKYPDNPFGKMALGFYAFTRATMLRKMRTPAPQVEIGEDIF